METTLARLHYFQIKHGITDPIWTLDYKTLSVLNYHDNLSATILFRMAQLDFEFIFNGDLSEWSLPGSSQAIFSMIYQVPDHKRLFKSFWNSSVPVFRIEQCNSPASNTILPWTIVKSNLKRSKKGRTPLWYTWLSGRSTNLSIDLPIQQNWRPNTLPPTMDKRKKEWVFFADIHHNITAGRISSKSASTNSVIITHWAMSPIPFVFTPCQGCDSTSWISTNNFCCIQKPRSLTALIPESAYKWDRSLNELTAYLDNLYTNIITLLHPLELPTIHIDTLDVQLIKSSFASTKTSDDLVEILERIESSSRILGLTSLDIYTDGSLDHSIHTTDKNLLWALVGSSQS